MEQSYLVWNSSFNLSKFVAFDNATNSERKYPTDLVSVVSPDDKVDFVSSLTTKVIKEASYSRHFKRNVTRYTKESNSVGRARIQQNLIPTCFSLSKEFWLTSQELWTLVRKIRSSVHIITLLIVPTYIIYITYYLKSPLGQRSWITKNWTNSRNRHKITWQNLSNNYDHLLLRCQSWKKIHVRATLVSPRCSETVEEK